MKKVLIISASPRKGGNSDTLCDQFAKGATEAGHDVEKIRLTEKQKEAMEQAGIDFELSSARELIFTFIFNYLNKQQ